MSPSAQLRLYQQAERALRSGSLHPDLGVRARVTKGFPQYEVFPFCIAFSRASHKGECYAWMLFWYILCMECSLLMQAQAYYIYDRPTACCRSYI